MYSIEIESEFYHQMKIMKKKNKIIDKRNEK